MIADFEYFVRDTNRRFLEQSISLDQDWLVGCIEWFLSETPNILIDELYRKALEQWQLSDIAESGLKCIPDVVQSNTKEFELNGKYVLQMQYLIDIGRVFDMNSVTSQTWFHPFGRH